MKNINRKDFLNNLGILGAAAVITPVISTAATLAAPSPVAPAFAGKKIRVGLIGCGSVSNMYLPNLLKSPFVEVVSLCDIKPRRAESSSKKYNVTNWYPDIESMLEGVPFDLLVNTTDMQEHGRLNRIALSAGKNVWSEKPMANTYREGRDLYDLAKEKGIRIWGAPAVVNSPQFAFMARQINDGKLGRIAAAHAHYGHEGPGWSSFFYEKNGGSMPDLGVYNIASLTGLLGPVVSIVAMTNVINPTRNIDNKGKIDVVAEDNAHILMEHKSGVLSHIQCGFNYFDPYGHAGTGQERPTISIVGSEGNMHMIGYDWKPSAVDMATKDQHETKRFATDLGTYVWEEGASAIAEAMVTGKEPLINVEHSLHVLEIIEAARKSQKKGKRVALKSVFKWPVI